MTRAIALIIVGAALLVQLTLGTDPLVVILCGLALVVGFFPALVFRLDLYGMLAAFFAIRYVGAALMTKTWLMQPLDQYLNAPVAAYALSCLLMFVIAGIVLLVRAFDRGTTYFPLPENAEALRLLGLVAFAIGATAYVASGLVISRETDAAATGVLCALRHAWEPTPARAHHRGPLLRLEQTRSFQSPAHPHARRHVRDSHVLKRPLSPV